MRPPVIIGTAGHVDHGKTTLIRVLTGVDTDRLQEEKERELTIDLGFAPFDLPDGRRLGVIDVPGHEKFMSNMLAGIGGIDLVLLVIDANEGVMPQTKEHLEVISLLQIKTAIVVLTKIETVDGEWLDLVEEEVREELAATPYKGSAIIRVSALQGLGLEELKSQIAEVIETLKPKDSSAPLRIPVDRAFKIKGFGTVITGTLLAGIIEKDQQVEILPEGIFSRIRNIEVHNQSVEKAFAGQRVALNLAGVEKDEVGRGNIIVEPGYFTPTDRIDVELELLPDFPHPLKHASRIHFHLGTSDLLAKVYLFKRKELLPGERAFAQLELDQKIVAYYQDLFIFRFYSPVKTMGGGRILNVKPGFYRKYRAEELAELELLAGGNSEDLVLQRILHYGIISRQELKKEVKLGSDYLVQIESLLKKEQIFQLGDNHLMSWIRYRKWRERLRDHLETFHQQNHLKPGLSKAELKQVFPQALGVQEFDLFLNELMLAGEITMDQYIVSLGGFKPTPTEAEKLTMQQIKDLLSSQKIETHSPADLAMKLKLDMEMIASYLEYLCYLQELVKITVDYYLERSVFTQVQTKVIDFLNKNDEITLAQARDLLQSSRKYTLPILEYLDEIKLTRRQENVRVLA